MKKSKEIYDSVRKIIGKQAPEYMSSRIREERY
jgi:hypothetical protein